jgi:hypothetical protein
MHISKTKFVEVGHIVGVPTSIPAKGEKAEY